MTLRCHHCGKALLRYAVCNTGSDGVEYGYGPKCGAAYIVRKRRKAKPPKSRAGARPRARDARQMDWINEVAA